MSFHYLQTRVLLVAFVLLASVSQAVVGSEIPWSTDIEGSLQRAAASGRPVLMEFTADWCMYCKRMEKTTFVDPNVVKFVNQHYVAVRIDADENKQLVADLDIKGLPAILIVSPELQIIERIPGFQTPEALLTKLNRASSHTQQQVASNAPAGRPAKPPVVARPASAAAAPEHRATKHDLQFEAIESEPVAAGEPAEEQQPRFEPAEEEDEEMTFEAEAIAENDSEFTEDVETETEGPASEEENDFFATVSQQKAPEPKKTVAVPKNAAPARTAPEDLNAPEFEGNCLVAAVVNREIIPGSARHQVKYRGHMLYFSTDEAKQEFLTHPNEYWPLFDGICSVSMVNDEERVMGKLEYAAFFRKRLWLFSSEENLKQFLEDPADVAEEMQELASSKSAR